MGTKPKAVVALSGGMDSATVLAEAMRQGRQIAMTIGFRDSSKRSLYENRAAKELSWAFNVPFRVIDLQEATKGLTLLGRKDGDSSEGHDIFFNRLFIISLMVMAAKQVAADEIWDPLYRGQCNYWEALVAVCTHEKFLLQLPFIGISRLDAIKQGLEMDVPYRLTRSCVAEQPRSCGRCDKCIERRQLLSSLDAFDEIDYEYTGPIKR